METHEGGRRIAAAAGKSLAWIAAIALIAPSARADEPAPGRPVEAELSSMAEASAKKMPPEAIAAGKKGVEEVAASGVLKTALNVGGTMPSFTLGDARGKPVSGAALLTKGPLVVVFYRGAWCPYCNIYLHAWQARLPELQSRGATLVAVSGEPPDRTAAVVQKTEATFTVLSDPGYAVSRKFGVVYEVPRAVAAMMAGRGLEFKSYYGTEKAELPLSATYVVGRDGKVTYAFLDADYKKRAEPADVLAALDRLGKSQACFGP
jgi:peroxiredoxin